MNVQCSPGKKRSFVSSSNFRAESTRGGNGGNGWKDNSSIDLYLRDIKSDPKKYCLLTREQEKELSRRNLEGDYRASRELAEHNLRLVIKIARNYMNSGLPLADLIQDGNTGLAVAAKRFDYRENVKFASYAAWWIKQSITRALSNTARTIRIPVHVLAKIKEARRLAESEPNIKPQDPRLKAIGYDYKMIYLGAGAFKDADDMSTYTFEEVLQDTNQLTSSDKVMQKDSRQKIRGLLDKLEKREAEVLFFRFGFDGNNPLTLDQVGNQFHVTRERIRQVQKEALAKLRKYCLELR